MAQVELFVFLLFAVVVLAGLGLRSGVPYPVVLVVGGLVIGLVPGLPSPEVDPDIILFVFLPPLLYAAAIGVSTSELKANAKPIGLLAVGLVLVTIAAVAAVANVVLGIPWAAGFVLGAVLGPTDPVSAAAVLDRLGVTGRAKTILKGESLVNDASGLTAYRLAVAAVGASAGSVFEITGKFVGVALGGIAIGLVVGWVFAHLRRIVTDPSLDVALSLLTPFVAYVPAEEVHVSGVLATVTAGLFIGARSLDIIEPSTRLRTLAFWESTAFLLDGLLFVLIGLQVPTIIERIEDADFVTLGLYALLITAVVMGVRALWMLVIPTFLHSDTTKAERIVIAWSGMRGGVSLAVALAIPVDDFPNRDLVIFVAYATIVLTLVLPGLTLSALVKRLGLQQSEEHKRQDAEARLKLTQAALDRLDELEDDAPDHVVQRLRDRYGSRLERLEARVEGNHDEDGQTDVARAGKLMAEMIEAEREVLRGMRRDQEYPTDVLREMERELDLDDSRLRARIRL
ncbi:sodium/proton antiporter (CPA1 family) [Solirubrobacter pauli]|uniref:Sodium/proton antiporter (CPA1 family) n=1 Tax=Solirubrobacter pauli TaxID=166793 RepID=A0A660L9Y3_9ACTN|nr:Na+/H+ antiporter [Solirubrobacter pauli]RKQ91339.1 sodium/proton antiporter (CPA1 family) [Solirubrobacter pauli]